jgi:hypothetical protein
MQDHMDERLRDCCGRPSRVKPFDGHHDQWMRLIRLHALTTLNQPCAPPTQGRIYQGLYEGTPTASPVVDLVRATPGTPAQDGRRAMSSTVWPKVFVSVVALTSLLLLVLKGVEVQTGIVVLVAIAILPWVAAMIETMELPGGGKLSFREHRRRWSAKGSSLMRSRRLSVNSSSIGCLISSLTSSQSSTTEVEMEVNTCFVTTMR